MFFLGVDVRDVKLASDEAVPQEDKGGSPEAGPSVKVVPEGDKGRSPKGGPREKAPGDKVPSPVQQEVAGVKRDTAGKY